MHFDKELAPIIEEIVPIGHLVHELCPDRD